MEIQKIAIYAHLFDPMHVEQLIKRYNKYEMQFFTTAAAQDAFAGKSIQPIYGAAIKTEKIHQELIDICVPMVKGILKHPTIHLGGSYKNSAGKLVEINNEYYTNALQKLPVRESEEVSVILHPRVFFGCVDDAEKSTVRLNNIRNTLRKLGVEIVRLCASEDIITKLLIAGISPDIKPEEVEYSWIVHALNHPESHELFGPQFISADQYNAFSDIPGVTVFALNPKDLDQMRYAESLSSKCVDLTVQITDFLQDREKTFVGKLQDERRSPSPACEGYIRR